MLRIWNINNVAKYGISTLLINDRAFRSDSFLHVRIYSTQSNNNEWTCKRMYEIPEDFTFVVELEIPVITLQAKEIEEVQVETKEDLKQHQTQEETNGGFISLLDILHPLLNNKIYNSIAAYYQEDCETINDINDNNLQDYDNTTETDMIDDNDGPKVCYKTNTFKLDDKWEIKSIYKSTDKYQEDSSKEHIVSPLLLSDDKSLNSVMNGS
ncbi:hypothetical protein C1646_817134 [Rhizophagus diaphanus]|nr:hypothetical protein C1646_817134 [Rhizophagus diaphanus] [Rhizophagus sp. MUCL 43196]